MKSRKKNVFLCKVGHRIKEERKKKGLSQESLANMCGFKRPYLSDVECGKRNISLNSLEKLLNALQIKLNI